jgi:hypothetical protein
MTVDREELLEYLVDSCPTARLLFQELLTIKAAEKVDKKSTVTTRKRY